ncbi:MAG TPA: hypothetical protein VJ934_04520, partial [Desulfomicrobiaceae bacterium]|nr:hypothetical protein [Desulfomicrobiaceae bacterium]
MLPLILCPGPEQGVAQTKSLKSISEHSSETPGAARDRAGQISPGSVKDSRAVQPELLSLHRQGRLTVRALGAFGLLPEGFMPAARELRKHDLDLLAADRATIVQWLDRFEKGELSLTPDQGQTLKTLLTAMALDETDGLSEQDSGLVKGGPAEWVGELPPLPEPRPMRLAPDTDLRSLGAERYAGMVSLAKEAVAELLGVMDASQQQAFDELWQPMYAFPAPECIAYLEKVIPLVEQALSLRTAVIEGTKQTSELWHAAVITAQYD